MIILGFAIEASAKLAMDTFERLVKESELIVEATPISFVGNKTIFKINRFHKGKISSNTIEVSHANEVHEQRIRVTGKHILFLSQVNKSDNTLWSGTSYGRSYWPLLPVPGTDGQLNKDCQFAVPYIYPFTMVAISKSLNIKNIKIYYQYLDYEKNGIEQAAYCEQDIINSIKYLSDN